MKILVTAVALAIAFPAAAQTARAVPPAHDEHAQHRQHMQDCHCCCCDQHGTADRNRDGCDEHAQHRGHDGHGQ